jgi:hypothetical protein
LERQLKAEYGADSAIPYKIMNAKGYMRGNKETAKGKAADAKHRSDMSGNLGKHLHAKGGGSVATRIRARMK